METSIFPFVDQQVLQLQDDNLCERLYDDFWTRVLRCDERLSLPKGSLRQVKDSCSSLVWLASYASVVISRPLDSRYSSISLIGLDRWQSSVHASVMGRESTAIPDVASPAFYDLGRILTTATDQMMQAFKGALFESEANNTGNRRGQQVGHQGNQKTPSFARTVLSQVMTGCEKLPPIQGGTTDVGLHTGCVRRNTSFPLVLSAIHSLLWIEGEETDQVFNKCVSTYLLGYLTEVAAQVTKFDARKVDRVVTIIREIATYLQSVDDAEFFEFVVGVVNQHHARLLELRPGDDAGSFTSLRASVSDMCAKVRAPKFPEIPDLSVKHDRMSQIVQAKSDAQKNLAWSDLESFNFTGNLQDAWVQISKFNVYFWHIATKLEDKDGYSIPELRERLALYSKQVAVAHASSLQTPHIMTVCLASYELLAAWICFCWAHRTAEEQHPLFIKYGSALDPADLRHLVLDDMRAIDAVDHVRRFLKPRFAEKSAWPFRTQSDTLKLALEYGFSSETLRRAHAAELGAANKLIEERWQGIVKIQTELSELDSKLMNAKRDLISASGRRQVSEQVDFEYDRRGRNRRHKVFFSVYWDHVAEESRCRSIVNALEARIRDLETKPAAIWLGLPRGEHLSLQWLFFLFMPSEFRDLSALAQLAQSKLWKAVPPPQTRTQNLLSWYRSHRKATSDPPSEAEMMLLSQSGSVHIDTPGIRVYSRETGIFFPDSYSIDPTWAVMDPFALGRINKETAMLFTELLPRVDQSEFLQRFVAMIPTNTTENEGIARRERKPEWLTQEQFVAFTTLRAGPHAQIRCLVETLEDNLLPFQHECVHIIIKQLLFHIGESSWKVDLTEEWNGFALLAAQMRYQVDLLRESPKDCDRLLIFAIMSSFLGQCKLGRECRSCAREFADIARCWANDVSKEVLVVEQVPPELYWKQAKLYGYALLCYSLGGLEDVDYLRLAELVILFKNKALFASAAEESDTLDQPILHLMTCRIAGIVDAVFRLNHLTTCLSLVVAVVPKNLEWRPVRYDGASETACFEAEADHLYSVNLLNGTVLVDGVPPGLLPSSVVDDPLYCRTFGKRNFEMIVLGFRRYRAARCVDDRFLYEFVVDSEDTLHIFEYDVSVSDGCGNIVLLLLRKEQLDLPALVRENHSHWYSEHHRLVAVRKPFYQDRCVEYAMTRFATFSLPPTSLSDSLPEVERMLPKCDRLVLGETALSKTLKDFEYQEFIHLTVNEESTMIRYSFPRYMLSFQLKDSLVESDQFKGFYMQDIGVLNDTLPGLSSFIVIANADGRQKVLISDGRIGNLGQIEIPKDWSVGMCYHIYNVHGRFRSLIAVNTVGRLHLAGLFASTACAVADRRIGVPGTVVATELVRQSWKNEPLTAAELSKLVEVSSHSNLSCTLRLMCSWVWRSSNSVAFLHAGIDEPRDPMLDLDLLALDEYRRNAFAPRLTACEELTLLGTQQPKRNASELRGHMESEIVVFVREKELALREKFIAKRRPRSKPRFPLSCPKNVTELERTIYDDLQQSYRIFCGFPKIEIRAANADFEKEKREVERRRASLESSLLGKLVEVDQSPKLRLSQLTGRIAVASTIDLLRIVDDDSIVARFNPCLNVDSRTQLRLECVDWAILCVLEDKMQRILTARRDEDDDAMLIELECIREWSPLRHLRWLAFEVEQQLQVRPNQFAIVKQLQGSPGSAIQLNMGLGKTRVLVPLLILDLMSSTSIGRVNMLASIINEALAYYRAVLVASVQNVKLFSLPFDRSVPLDAIRSSQLSDEIARCKEQYGCLVVTPQHRNSLLLKQYDQGEFVDGLNESFVDILDESDAILSHDFQLVYALGTQVPLPGGPCRWTVLQALLTVIARSESKDIVRITKDDALVHRECSKFGSFPKIRLLLPFQGREHELGVALCKQLLTDPPYELRWLKEVPSEKVELLISVMADPAFQKVLDTIHSNALFKEKQSDILASRGFIAYGSLFHGLESRYRVNYGLNTTVGSKTKMAVPYSASDTPKQRAQYSHPDMELVYTTLSYFHEGLTESQLKAALEHLQTMGPSAQRSIYGEWVNSVQKDVNPDDLSKFDDILKVDVSNKLLLSLVHDKLRNSMEVISFWTNNFVYRTETSQFPSKRATNAWNLCDSGQAMGFSGTDDNRQLLPLSISQIAPDEEHLRATNGAMIRRILDCTTKVHVLPDADEGSLMWQHVLKACLSLRVHVLIDAAGLMAGSRNDHVAKFLSECLKHTNFHGVVYFDADTDQTWFVYEMEYRRAVPLESSSLTEAECFTFFDESRCRGSDLKLRKNAVALVTLEPKMAKDKFLQSCARMRKLGAGTDSQSLILAGTVEVVSSTSTIEQVLEKILHNTAQMTKKGLLTFYQRGLNYASFPEPIADDISLEGMYASHIPAFDLNNFLDATHENEVRSDAVEELVEYCKDVGQGVTINGMSRMNEECEQELEEEVEEEEEQEMEFSMEYPTLQEDWPFAEAFSNPEKLFPTLFIQLKGIIEAKLKCLSVVPWSEKVYCTPNFWKTIQAAETCSDLSCYLRPVNAMLVMPLDGRVVLLSAYELDKLLPVWWTASRQNPRTISSQESRANLQHLLLPVWRMASFQNPITVNSRESSAILLHLSMADNGQGFGRDAFAIPDEVLTSVKLFRGYVDFSEKQKKVLAKMLRHVPESHLVVQELLCMRSRLLFFRRSDLEAISSKIHC